MRTISALLGFAVLAILATGCDDDYEGTHTGNSWPFEPPVNHGATATETRSVSDFDSISLEGAGRLILEQTGTETLTITAEDEILPLLRSEVRGRRLTLGPEPNSSIQTSSEIIYRLTVKVLSEIVVVGAGDVDAAGIDAQRLEISMIGAGHVKTSGAVDRLGVRIIGAGRYAGEDLESRLANVEVAGAGKVVVRVQERLSGTLAGASIVEYIGDPVVTIRVSATCVVRKR